MNDILIYLYFLIGILFYLFRFQKMARGFANATGRFIVKYSEKGPNDPGTFDYLVTADFIKSASPHWQGTCRKSMFLV